MPFAAGTSSIESCQCIFRPFLPSHGSSFFCCTARREGLDSTRWTCLMKAREWGNCDKVCKDSSGKRKVCRKGGLAHLENVIHESALPWPKFDKLNVVLHSGAEIL